MGNEMSAESGHQGLEQEFDLTQLEATPVFVEQNLPETSPKSEADEAREMDEAEISRLLKMDSSKIDVYDTGVSDELKKLLATLHDDDSLDVALASNYMAGGLSAGKPTMSVSAQEFVPGKPFNYSAASGAAGTLERETSSMSSSDPSAGFGTLKADAPEFVPSWQNKSSAGGLLASVTGGVLPSPISAGNVRVIDKKVWFYRDPASVVRGPFSTTEMRAWSDKGYFTGSLEIALSDRGPYLPLSSVYPSPERPFWKSIEPREFATRMRQHILATRSDTTNL